MPAQKPQRPRTRQALLGVNLEDQRTSRAIDEVRDVAQRVAASPALSRSVITADLALGLNKLNHQLGRVARGYSITPSVPDATFAHALVTSGNTQQAAQIWINVIGVAQPGAVVEVF